MDKIERTEDHCRFRETAEHKKIADDPWAVEMCDQNVTDTRRTCAERGVCLWL